MQLCSSGQTDKLSPNPVESTLVCADPCLKDYVIRESAVSGPANVNRKSQFRQNFRNEIRTYIPGWFIEKQ